MTGEVKREWASAKSETRFGLYRGPDILIGSKTSVRLRLGVRKAIPTSHCQHNLRREKFNYQQIYREGDFAIYKQTWKGNEHSAVFEVIRIRQREGFRIGGRFVEPAEVYPGSEAWSVDGFTLTDKDAAFAKLMVSDNSVGNIRRRNRSLYKRWEKARHFDLRPHGHP